MNIYKCFANKQIDIFYYIAENSYKKIKESIVNVLFVSNVFYHYLKRDWNVSEINALVRCMH